MTDETTEGGAHAAASALEAMLGVVAEARLEGEHRTAAAALSEEDYGALVAMAWRHQFADDRLGFKRQLREMEQVVGVRMLQTLEGNR